MWIDNFRECSFDRGDHSYHSDSSGTLDSSTHFKDPHLSGCCREVVLEHFKITYVDLKFSERHRLAFSLTGQTVEMVFVLKGASLIKCHLPQKEFYLSPNTHNIINWESSEGAVEFEGTDSICLMVNFSPEYIKKFIPFEKDFAGFSQLITDRKLGCLKNNNYPIGPEIHSLLNDILNCTWKGHYRKIYLNAKILELLLCQLEQFKLPFPLKNSPPLSILEGEKILLAKDYVQKNYRKPLKLQDLAKKLGTNEFALKKGFKAMFGTTVFGCIHELKMKKAKKLLLDRKMSIAQISDHIGYKNPQHFSTAFKKSFGISPSDFKK